MHRKFYKFSLVFHNVHYEFYLSRDAKYSKDMQILAKVPSTEEDKDIFYIFKI